MDPRAPNQYDQVVLRRRSHPIPVPQRPLPTRAERNLHTDDPHPPRRIDSKLATAITAARVARGLTRKQVAQALFLRENVVAALENGTGPHPDGPMLARLRNVLRSKLC